MARLGREVAHTWCVTSAMEKPAPDDVYQTASAEYRDRTHRPGHPRCRKGQQFQRGSWLIQSLGQCSDNRRFDRPPAETAPRALAKLKVRPPRSLCATNS